MIVREHFKSFSIILKMYISINLFVERDFSISSIHYFSITEIYNAPSQKTQKSFIIERFL